MLQAELNGEAGGNVEAQNAERRADSGNPAQRVREVTRYYIENLSRGCLCHIVAENLTVFCPCPEKSRKA